MDKMKSRKFWMALVGALLPILAAFFSQEMPVNEAVMESVAIIAAYIFVQVYVDGKEKEQAKVE